LKVKDKRPSINNRSEQSIYPTQKSVLRTEATPLQYPSLEDALAFDSSPEYTALKAVRDKSTKWRSFVVEGLPDH
jgi:uncharacterized protein (DUF1330 family)